MRHSIRIASLLALLPLGVQAQWQPQAVATTTEFRSVHAVDSMTVWAGGRGGVFAHTRDGGHVWQTDTVPGATDLFFIGVHAASADTAVLLGTGFSTSTARIYRTTDGGRTWSERYRDDREGIFLDGVAFWDDGRGLAFGDPLDGAFVVLITSDGGATWEQLPGSRLPPPLAGEAAFAASGQAIVTGAGGRAWFGTGGGASARVYRTTDHGRTWQVAETPLAAGTSTGVFGLAFRDSLNGVAVGGNHEQRNQLTQNVIRTRDGGVTWTVQGASLPPGVRYGVTYVPGVAIPTIVAVGPSGSGYSYDEGITWTALDGEVANTVTFTDPRHGWALGIDGRIVRWKGELGGK